MDHLRVVLRRLLPLNLLHLLVLAEQDIFAQLIDYEVPWDDREHDCHAERSRCTLDGNTKLKLLLILGLTVHGNCACHAYLVQINWLRRTMIKGMQPHLRDAFIKAEEIAVHGSDDLAAVQDVMVRLVDDHVLRVDAQLQCFRLLKYAISEQVVSDSRALVVRVLRLDVLRPL